MNNQTKTHEAPLRVFFDLGRLPILSLQKRNAIHKGWRLLLAQAEGRFGKNYRLAAYNRA
jgi:hypothetical protein